jgi:hypothetical protein
MNITVYSISHFKPLKRTVCPVLYRGAHQRTMRLTSDFGEFSTVALPLFVIRQLLWGMKLTESAGKHESAGALPQALGMLFPTNQAHK